MFVRIFVAEHFKKEIPGHVLAWMLGQVGSKLRVPFCDVENALEANLCCATLDPFNKLSLMNADEIVFCDLIHDDSVNPVLSEQTIAPALPLLQPHLFEPFVIEIGRIEQPARSITGVL